MRIISQKGKDIPYNEFWLDKTYHYGTEYDYNHNPVLEKSIIESVEIIAKSTTRRSSYYSIKLGEYNSEERALEVMEEIRKHARGLRHEEISSNLCSPRDWGGADLLDLDYQMPKE